MLWVYSEGSTTICIIYTVLTYLALLWHFPPHISDVIAEKSQHIFFSHYILYILQWYKASKCMHEHLCDRWASYQRCSLFLSSPDHTYSCRLHPHHPCSVRWRTCTLNRKIVHMQTLYELIVHGVCSIWKHVLLNTLITVKSIFLSLASLACGAIKTLVTLTDACAIDPIYTHTIAKTGLTFWPRTLLAVNTIITCTTLSFLQTETNWFL